MGWLIMLSPPRGLSCLDMSRQGLCVPLVPPAPLQWTKHSPRGRKHHSIHVFTKNSVLGIIQI